MEKLYQFIASAFCVAHFFSISPISRLASSRFNRKLKQLCNKEKYKAILKVQCSAINKKLEI